MITIVGPTASGKTTLAAHLAVRVNGEILSGDSRQVYRGMDLGTGKDLVDYVVDGVDVPYHLIDIRPAGDKFNLFEYQRAFHQAYDLVLKRGKTPILCGGTGLYIESILKGYELHEVPENPELRQRLENKSLEELTDLLQGYKELHNQTDTDTVKRAIRAIEIADFTAQYGSSLTSFPAISSTIIGLDLDREVRRQRISQRLFQRLEEGMIEEVDGLLRSGISADDLIYYGLEYKYLTLYLTGQLTKEEMIAALETAIHQFAKRQMTWFRGMERRGFTIHWIDALLPMEEKIEQILEIIAE